MAEIAHFSAHSSLRNADDKTWSSSVNWIMWFGGDKVGLFPENELNRIHFNFNLSAGSGKSRVDAVNFHVN